MKCGIKSPHDNITDHCGSMAGYVAGYACKNSNKPDRIMVVSFSPADVVSVCDDASCGKLRVCRYKVESEYTGPLVLQEPARNNKRVQADDRAALQDLQDSREEEEKRSGIVGWLCRLVGRGLR